MTDNILYTFGRYNVQKIPNHFEEGYGLIEGYGVVNTRTEVTEYSTTVLFNAMRWSHTCEAQMRKLEAMSEEDILKQNGWPENVYESHSLAKPN